MKAQARFASNGNYAVKSSATEGARCQTRRTV
jgi:hypothetical protein